MDRKEFIRTCGFACLGVVGAGILWPGCAGARLISAEISGDNMIVPIADFEINKKEVISYRNYVVVQNELLQYPICVYRFSEKDYTALYMRCTHQGAELTAYGDKLVCSAHGSEFDNRGGVTGSPADKPLRAFPVLIENQQLKISLKVL